VWQLVALGAGLMGAGLALAWAASSPRAPRGARGELARLAIALFYAGVITVAAALPIAHGLTVESHITQYEGALEEWYGRELPPLAYDWVLVTSILEPPENASNVSARVIVRGVPWELESEELVNGSVYIYRARVRIGEPAEWLYSPLLGNEYKSFNVTVEWEYMVGNETQYYHDRATVWLIRRNVTHLWARIASVDLSGCATEGQVTVEIYNPALGYPPPGDPYWGEVLPPLPGQLVAEIYVCVEAYWPASGHLFPGICYARPVYIEAGEAVNVSLPFPGDPRWGRIAVVHYQLAGPHVNAAGGVVAELNSTIAAPLAALEVAYAPAWPVTVEDANGTLHTLEAPGIVCVQPGPVTVTCPGCAAWEGAVFDYTVVELQPAGGSPESPRSEYYPPSPRFALAVTAVLMLILAGLWLILGRPGLDW